ncbi:GLPGLI family protein [Sungkyunkwania multivorans]|uniref:GLPGLI family protein n=1 Tax=Sungkyunkwania multivorans TaxID=1173618 RepID=A0ABW3CVR2_9FLAO
MKSLFFKFSLLTLLGLLSYTPALEVQEFQGQATYFAKSSMELGRWGARMSEAQKKQVQARLKNRLEKTYVLNFNKEESVFNEEEKLDAMSGATDSWGKNFSPGEQYKNVKENKLVQSQEFYGKRFLVKDELLSLDWQMGKESKQIGQYLCFKAMALIPKTDLKWYDFSWGDLRRAAQKETDSTSTESTMPEIEMVQVEAWYTPQIPVGHGPGEFWGLPGLILEVSAGNTTMLCSKIVMNPKEKLKIEAPEKGKVITKSDYKETITAKMQEMRDNRGRRRS